MKINDSNKIINSQEDFNLLNTKNEIKKKEISEKKIQLKIKETKIHFIKKVI